MDDYEELYNEYTLIKNDLKGVNIKDLSGDLNEKFKKLKEY